MNIVITGASSGIGFELAHQFAKSGNRVLAIARNRDNLIKLVELSKNIEILELDLSRDDSKSKFIESIATWISIDILINNAGQLINKPFLETSTSEFESMMNVNLLSIVRMIQWSYNKLLKSNKAHVVNISSMGGFQGSSKFPGLSAYSTSKGAISVLTECLATEFAETKIHFNALALGAVGTRMLNNAFPGYHAPISASQMAAYILNFADTGAKYYNGKVLPVALGSP
jgi:short-subunit dehydrogenase